MSGFSLLAAVPACAAPPAPKVLTVCTEGSPGAFNPMLGANGTTFDANRPIYNRLVQFRPGTTIPAPALATSWDVSADGLTYTFHLRHNVVWQSNEDFRPSHPLDSADVAFSFQRQWQDANPYHTVSGGNYVYFGYMGFGDLLAGIDTPDAQTVRFTLKRAYAPFLADLAMDFAAIQSKEYADTLARLGRPEQIDQRPIGTGPFQLAAYQEDHEIRYQPFAHYWGTKAKYDSLVFAITPDATARATKLRGGACQVALFPNLSDLPTLRGDAHLQVLAGPGLDVGFVAFNTTHKPLDDVRVRTALGMAIDRHAILAEIYQGAGMAAHNLLPPTVVGGDTSSFDLRYDPAAAKRMLAAGS